MERVTLVPHTHWDREWYAPFAEFRPRLVAMMDALLELADRGFPHFHLDGQTAMIDDYLAVRPEREPELRRHVRAGRLSAGPWVTQMDAFLVSGESHIRNLEMGLARARELGRALEVGYLPDQFGHIGQMPQILRSAGIEHAVVWRGVPRTVDRDVFRWEAPDGSEVLAEYLAFGYFNGEAYRRAEDPRELARRIEETLGRQRPFRASDRILVMVGSDHAGPDPSLPQRVAAAASHLEGVEVRIGGLEDHLGGRRLRGPVPTHRGELRSSARANLLTGVASARANQKRERARVEALLERAAEPLAALVPGFPWPEERLREAWTLLLWNGAHDSACGCSHDRVARDVAARFAAARAIAEAVVDEALTTLGARVAAAGTIRFNPSPFERDGVPGLGWRVVAGGAEPAELPLSVGIEDGWVRAAGLAFALRDEPDQGDLYTFCPGGEARPPERLETDGRTVRATWPGLEVRLRLRRLRGEPFLRLEGAVRNERPDHRLRLHLRLPERAEGSLAGSPFELVRRPLLGEGGVEPPSPLWPARGVVAAGGLAALAEGVVEYEVTGGELAITLLRCVGTISRERLETRPYAAGPDVPTPEAQMLGTWPLALGAMRAGSPSALLAAWERFALPLLEAPATGGGSLPAAGTLLELEGEACLSAVRRVGGELEVRVWNPLDRPARARVEGLELDLGPARIQSVALGRARARPA
ncbi:Mannosylglycerate hydrolase [bacterium HR12]|nr:Mannosylglycerate hydrolase [bacterium HR12]